MRFLSYHPADKDAGNAEQRQLFPSSMHSPPPLSAPHPINFTPALARSAWDPSQPTDCGQPPHAPLCPLAPTPATPPTPSRDVDGGHLFRDIGRARKRKRGFCVSQPHQNRTIETPAPSRAQNMSRNRTLGTHGRRRRQLRATLFSPPAAPVRLNPRHRSDDAIWSIRYTCARIPGSRNSRVPYLLRTVAHSARLPRHVPWHVARLPPPSPALACDRVCLTQLHDACVYLARKKVMDVAHPWPSVSHSMYSGNVARRGVHVQ
ncbi:hypothetical protein B0H11DRAFT_2052162 [Mycena galericulata]|nr:hypothetical protein B0H11DRAFT_2052162 [Mycena galericulata]